VIPPSYADGNAGKPPRVSIDQPDKSVSGVRGECLVTPTARGLKALGVGFREEVA
jgi:hypothetical protein